MKKMMSKKQKYCIAFDLDNTLCESIRKNHPDDIMKVLPKKEMIKTLKELKKRGHTITIFTRRDVCGKESRKLTIKWLRKYKIPYDRLITEKPHYDILIDDRAINAYIPTINSKMIELNANFIQTQNNKNSYNPMENL